jgi:hypothetical protein
MKSSIRTFALAAFAAATITSVHSASAQHIYARATSAEYTLPAGGGLVTINALDVSSAGTYVIGGQQAFVFTPSTAQTVLLCYTANTAGSVLPDGAYSMITVPPGSSYITVPLNGYFVTTGATEILVNCRYYGSTNALSGVGTITAIN